MTVEEARKIAFAKLAMASKGIDPAEEDQSKAADALTFAEICDWYLTDAESGRILGRGRRPIRPATLRMDRSRIDAHIRPLIGNRTIGSLKAPLESPCCAIGDLLGHGVRFRSADDVMAVGDGIETILSLRCALPNLPMAAALSANYLGGFLFPESPRRIYVACDNDPAGDVAFAALSERAADAGIEACSLMPALRDFDDDLRHLGLDELRSALRVQLIPEDVPRFWRAASIGGHE